MAGLEEFRQQYPMYNDMSDVDLTDKIYTKFYSDIPRSEFNTKFAEKFGKPKDVGFQEAAKGTIIGSLLEGVQAPGRTLQGDYNAEPPENPGFISETDIARQRMAATRLRDDAFKLGGAVMTGAMPGGIFGAPAGAIAMGGARPASGAVAAQTAKTAEAQATRASVVNAAERINTPIPRYMVEKGAEGTAAGLKNIPIAGEAITNAATNTQNALNTAIKGAETEMGSGSAPLAGTTAKDALTSWIQEGSQKVSSRLYDKVDDLVRPDVTTELKTTAQAVQKILDQRAASKIPGESAAVKTVLDAATTPGGMSYQGIKGLRTFLGEMTPQEIIAQGLKGSEVKQIYAAMSQDLRQSVLAAGGAKALTSFNKANTIYEQIAARRATLAKIVGANSDAPAEAVFARLVAMAGGKSSANIQALMAARKAMGPEAWNEVASALLSKLGRAPSGDFSIQRFITGYGNLSEGGKRALFKSTGKDTVARALDDIAFVTKAIDDKLQKFANPSGTARSLTATDMVMGAIHNPIKTLATLVGGARMAKALAEPATARATADWVKSYHDAITAPSATASAKVRQAAEKVADLMVPAGSKDGTAAKQLLVQQMLAGAGVAQ